MCVFFSRLKSSLLRGTFTTYKQLLSSFCVYILYYVYVYITEKRNKTSSRELLLLLKSDESATEWSFYSRAFRDEKKKTAFYCLGFIQLGFNSSSFLLFFSEKNSKFWNLSSPLVTFSLSFLCVCVCVCCCRLGTSSSNDEQK